MARLYANENFPQGVVQRLRSLGHEVLTVLEAGNANAAISDADVLAFAVTNQLAVITLNRRDFIRLHLLYQSTGSEHCGIIVCKQDNNLLRQADMIHSAIVSSNSLQNQLLRVTRQR